MSLKVYFFKGVEGGIPVSGIPEIKAESHFPFPHNKESPALRPGISYKWPTATPTHGIIYYAAEKSAAGSTLQWISFQIETDNRSNE